MPASKSAARTPGAFLSSPPPATAGGAGGGEAACPSGVFMASPLGTQSPQEGEEFGDVLVIVLVLRHPPPAVAHQGREVRRAIEEGAIHEVDAQGPAAPIGAMAGGALTPVQRLAPRYHPIHEW